MLILLPPSESKTRPDPSCAAGFDPELLSFPSLHAARGTMLRAAGATARSASAAARLGVPASAPELVARMAQLEQEPSAPALEVYSGVLYDQLDSSALPSPDRRVLIQSALLGVVDAQHDRIPAYRLSADSQVHRLGKAGAWWRRRLEPIGAALLAETAASPTPLVLDCRSSAYRAMMPLRSGSGVRVLEVSPVQERGGVRKVISHDAKRCRGWVTRALLQDQRPLPDADALLGLLQEAFAGELGVELEGDRLVMVDRAD